MKLNLVILIHNIIHTDSWWWAGLYLIYWSNLGAGQDWLTGRVRPAGRMLLMPGLEAVAIKNGPCYESITDQDFEAVLTESAGR